MSYNKENIKDACFALNVIIDLHFCFSLWSSYNQQSKRGHPNSQLLKNSIQYNTNTQYCN